MNKIFKLPRHLIAQIASDSPQAIRAIEQLEERVIELPHKLKEFEILVDEIHSVALQAMVMAGRHDDSMSMLPSVPLGMIDESYLAPVLSFDCVIFLDSV